jgi:uncharacterized membrane protein
MNTSFSISETLSTAWAIAKKNAWIVMGFTAVQFVVIFVFSIISGFFLNENLVASALVQVIIQLLDIFFVVAMYQVFFKLLDDEGEIEFPDLVPNFLKAVNFLLVKIMMAVIAVVLIKLLAGLYFMDTPNIDTSNLLSWEMLPILLLITIPILYMSIRLFFVLCFIVDQESGSIESISQSWTITRGNFWALLGLFLVLLGINILGAMALFVGLLFTYPLSILILMVAYRQMVNNYTDEEEILIEGSDKN